MPVGLSVSENPNRALSTRSRSQLLLKREAQEEFSQGFRNAESTFTFSTKTALLRYSSPG